MKLLGRLGDRGGAGRRRTGPNRRRAGEGGPGRIRADDVYPECWRSTHLSDDGGDTRRASDHCMCDIHMHTYRYDRAEVVLTLLDQSDFKDAIESRFERQNKRIGNVSRRIQP
jgi:hypothetical protein